MIAKFYLKEILSVLSHMHQKGVCHRDIKLDNIFLDSEFNLILGDFGLATSTKSDLEGLAGTIYCMPPEMLK